MANRYHLASTRHSNKRRSSACVPGIPFSRAVTARATKDGAKVPRSNNSPRTTASAGTVDAVPWEIAAAVMKQAQVTAYVRKKNLRREPTSAALLTSKYVGRAAIVPAPHLGRMSSKVGPLTPERGRILP